MIYELNPAEVEAYCIAQGTLPPGSKVISARMLHDELDILVRWPTPIPTLNFFVPIEI